MFFISDLLKLQISWIEVLSLAGIVHILYGYLYNQTGLIHMQAGGNFNICRINRTVDVAA